MLIFKLQLPTHRQRKQIPTYPTFKETHTPKKKRLQLDQIITDSQNGDIAYNLSLQRQAKLKYCINGAIQTIQLSDDLNEKYQQLCDGIRLVTNSLKPLKNLLLGKTMHIGSM